MANIHNGQLFLMWYETDVIYDTMQVDCGMDRCDVKIMDIAIFHTPICAILVVIIHSSRNKAVKVDGFAVNFGGI